jgi:RNA polymerase sigma-B factor
MKNLAWEDRSVEQMLAAFARSPDAALRAAIIERHEGLVRGLGRKFVRPGVEVADLVQVGWVALIGAVDRFDSGRGGRFAPYAAYCIAGEIKRYFRDRTWALKVPARLKTIAMSLSRTQEELYRKLHRQPLLPEMAEALSITEEELIEAMVAHRSYRPQALDDHPATDKGDPSLSAEEMEGVPDPRLERVAERDALRAALDTLDERGRTILRMRFQEGRKQGEVALAIGCSQVHVGRLERAALRGMRAEMDGRAPLSFRSGTVGAPPTRSLRRANKDG